MLSVSENGKDAKMDKPIYEKFVEHRFNDKSERLISQANDIIAEYRQSGYTLTLRQLYYQFVRAWVSAEHAEELQESRQCHQ